MIFNRITLFLLVFCLASIAIRSQSSSPQTGAQPQDPPRRERVEPELKDLAGEWELDINESDFRSGPPYLSGSLTVRVAGEEVIIKRLLEDAQGTIEREFSFYGDGRGEVNILFAADGGSEFQRPSRSRWKKGKLAIKFSQKSNMGWYDVEEVYALSADANKLTYTIITRFVSPSLFRPRGGTGKLVFRKK